MTDQRHAWQAYHDGNYDEAARLFDRAQGSDALAGRALSLLALKHGDEATELIRQALQRSPSPELEALLGDIKGRQGTRNEAEKLLTSASSNDKDNSFYRSLLGEQRLRQGRWEEGTNDFIAALSDHNEQTFAHIKRVVADMVDAVAARRIPRQDAMRFINRIDYSAADKTQAMNSFFARARRALNANRRMDRKNVPEPWSTGISAATASSAEPKPATPPPSNQPPERKRPPANRGGQKQQRKKKRPRSQGSARSRNAASQQRQAQDKKKKKMQERLSQRPEEMKPKEELLIEARQKDMTTIMQQERQLNESLQDLIEDVYPPAWPSEVKDPIDFISPIGFSDHAILRGSDAIETANFRITGGDIGIEITLERTMHNLIAAASATKPTTLPLTQHSIPRLELNLLDSFLDAMPELDDLYRDEAAVDDPNPLAVGKFIGECIVQSYGGSWQHEHPVTESIIYLGDHTLDPIRLAKKFLNSDDFDNINLRELIHQAEEAVDTSTSFPNFANYIDPTLGLEGEGLAMGLAELWVGYRFVVPDTEIPTIAASLEIIENNEAFLAFSIDARHTPGTIVEKLAGAVDSEGRARMAYIRESGEFLILASRKHFCRLMESSALSLNNDNGTIFAHLIQNFFRPGWAVMVDRETTEKWQHQLGDINLTPPGIRETNQEIALRVQAIDNNQNVQRIRLEYRPGAIAPYVMLLG